MKSLFRILTAAGLVLSANAAFAQPSYDPATGHAYEVVYSLMTFDQAKSYAEGLVLQGETGHLVTITSPAEQDFVTSLGPPLDAWIGGFQPPGSNEPDGGWTWITGEPWDYENWNTGEPNDSGGEDCAQWWTGNTWNDRDCSLSFYFIVEWDLTARPVPALSWPALALLASALLLLGAGWLQNKRRA